MNEIMYVVENSKNVIINTNEITNIISKISKNTYSHWSTRIDTFKSLDEKERILFAFILESMNFCFWNSYDWKMTYHKVVHLGSDALLYLLISAVESKKIQLRIEFLNSLTFKEFQALMCINGIVPALMNERFCSLKKTIKTIMSFPDFFETLYSIKSAPKMEEFIASKFQNFYDKSKYKGHTIVFNKRCRLLISDLYNISNIIHNNLIDYDTLLGCADYSIPRFFREVGVFNYSDRLAKKIDNLIEIKHNTPFEVEIRSCTLYVIEKIKEGILKNNIKMNSLELDNILWNMSRKTKKTNPHHTLSIYY